LAPLPPSSPGRTFSHSKPKCCSPSVGLVSCVCSSTEFIDGEDGEKKKIQVPNHAYDVWIMRDQQVVSYIMNSLSKDPLSCLWPCSCCGCLACHPRAFLFAVQVSGLRLRVDIGEEKPLTWLVQGGYVYDWCTTPYIVYISVLHL
jgi:hypothetical protein